MTIANYVLWDLDNCLADDRHRIPLIDWSKYPTEECWDAYHNAAGSDVLGNAQRFNEWHGPRTWSRPDAARPVFITARPERFRKMTHEWIVRNLSWGLQDTDYANHRLPFNLLMRADGDKRQSVLVKNSALLAWMRGNEHRIRIVQAFDDCMDIVRMYRALNIQASLLNIHGIETHAPPGAQTVTITPHVAVFGVRGGVGPLEETAADIEALNNLRVQKDASILKGQAEGVTDGIARARKLAQEGMNKFADSLLSKAAGGEASSPRERPDVEQILRDAAATFRQRNTSYGGAYKEFGAVLASLFQQGLSIPPNDNAGFGRLALMVMLAGKLHRYAVNYAEGGHEDSASDAVVYAAMLRELTDECPF